ncbi:MAG TPA: putative maltokinase, partial [Methylovirgula sp.]|nr:putative maltokinase [Methylovirgula sp.]
QAVELDLSEFVGRVPVELNNGSLFPPIGQLTYLLTLPPYGFYWFVLAEEGDWPDWHTPAPEPMPEYQTFVIIRDLIETLTVTSRELFERDVLPPYLAKRRWFSAKNEALNEVRLANIVRLPGREIYLCKLETTSRSGIACWLLPLAIVWEGESMMALPNQLALARVRQGRRVGLLTDAFALPEFAHGAIGALAVSATVRLPQGQIHFEHLPQRARALHLPPNAEVEWITAEQSNSSLIVGDAVMLKIFRRISSGPHPEVEMGRYLTERGFANAPPLLGEVVYVDKEGARSSMGVAQSFIRNQGDAWSWLLDDLVRGIDALATPPDKGTTEAEHMADYESLAAVIGRRLAEMHGVLAQETTAEDFAPRHATKADTEDWLNYARKELGDAFDMIGKHRWERPEDSATAKALMERRDDLLASMTQMAASGEGTLMTRIHGDFHLGQLLVVGGDIYIIDFEGEPGRPLAARRDKLSPLRDVAGLLRSLDYAAATVANRKSAGTATVAAEQRDSVLARFRTATPAAFLNAYRATLEARGESFNEPLLNLFMIEKSAYEIRYEAANRPSWLPIPLGGLAALVTRFLHQTGEQR